MGFKWDCPFDTPSFKHSGVPTCQALWTHSSFYCTPSWADSSAAMALALLASHGFQVYASSPELSPHSQTHSLSFPLENSTWTFCRHLKYKSHSFLLGNLVPVPTFFFIHFNEGYLVSPSSKPEIWILLSPKAHIQATIKCWFFYLILNPSPPLNLDHLFQNLILSPALLK